MIATLLADPEPRKPLAARSSMRVSRPPALEPPFDDERDDLGRLNHPPSAEPTAETSPRHGLHHRDTPTNAGATPDALSHRPPPPSSRAIAGLTAPSDTGSARAAMRYVRLCIEVLNGFRPASHLRSVSGPVEFSEVLAQLRYRRNGRGHFRNRPTEGISHQLSGNASARGTAARAGGVSPVPAVTNSSSAVAAAGVAGSDARVAGSNARMTAADAHALQAPTARVLGATAPGAAAFGATSLGATAPGGVTARNPGRNAAAANAPFGLTRLRVSEPLDGIAEVVAVLSQAGATIAMALRLERREADWLCTFAQVI